MPGSTTALRIKTEDNKLEQKKYKTEKTHFEANEMANENNKVRVIHYSFNKYALRIYYHLELGYSNK